MKTAATTSLGGGGGRGNLKSVCGDFPVARVWRKARRDTEGELEKDAIDETAPQVKRICTTDTGAGVRTWLQEGSCGQNRPNTYSATVYEPVENPVNMRRLRCVLKNVMSIQTEARF